ncbi:MAG: aminodeoxychorismate lyase, partial [Gammaproteobacteria bacterium]
MQRWWINGAPGQQVDLADRGFTYGDGLFETIAIREGRPRFLALHMDRLLDGCSRLGLELSGRPDLETRLVAAAREVHHGVLKVILTRGPGERGYRLPAVPEPTLAWGIVASEHRPAQPVEVRWCATMTSANPATGGLKTLGRLEQILARAEWSQPTVAEGLMTSTEGWVTGGTSSNLFLVSGDRLLTPAVNRAGIAGVMRRVVLESAADAGIGVWVGDLPPAVIATATEVFVTNALTGIRPVRQLDFRTWPTGPVTRLLQMRLAALG